MKRLLRRRWVISRLAAQNQEQNREQNRTEDQSRTRLNQRQQHGSVTLETALVMPVFLLLVFFLLFLVKTSIIMMALHGALSQTVRVAASAWYPITLIQSDDSRQEGEQDPSFSDKLSGARETIDVFGEWLPSPIGDWATNLSAGEWSPESEAAKLALRQLVLQLADAQVLEANRLRITDVDLPKENNAAEAFLTLKAEYRLPLRFPWNGQPLIVHASAKERAWIGGSPSRATLPDANGDMLDIKFVSLEPNPVRPGRKATLTLQTRPGATLNLSVIYKSGQSQAKHLGTAVADGYGRISWTWHVSGNTASGEWTWAVRGEGGAVYSQLFQVARISS